MYFGNIYLITIYIILGIHKIIMVILYGIILFKVINQNLFGTLF